MYRLVALMFPRSGQIFQCFALVNCICESCFQETQLGNVTEVVYSGKFIAETDVDRKLVQMEIKMRKVHSRDFGDDDKKEWPVIPRTLLVECEVTRCEIRELNPEFRAKYNIQDEVESTLRSKVDDPDYPEFQGQWLWQAAKPYLDKA